MRTHCKSIDFMISFTKCEKEVSPMQLVIYIFIALCTLAIAILFTEVTGKLFKALLALVAAASTGYSIALAARMIAKSTKWFSKPPLMNTFYISSAIVLVLIIIVTKVILKKKNG